MLRKGRNGKNRIMKTKKKTLRVEMENLPPRNARAADDELDYILNRVAGGEGSPCKRDCDCSFGLVCAEGRCISDW